MKQRYIQPYTEIQADQINELSTNLHNDMEMLIDGIVGATTGVAKGLNVTISDAANRILAITSGGISDGNGKFYELIADTTFTLPNVDGTYKIYAENTEITGASTSGYILTNVATQVENYQVINTLIYDGLTISGTTGALPGGTQQLATVTVTAGTAGGLVDDRQYSLIGATVGNSLQGFFGAGTNEVKVTNEITGRIMDDSGTTVWSKAEIDNAYAGHGFRVDTGTNAGARGFYANVQGGTGYFTLLNGAVTGAVVSGGVTAAVGMEFRDGASGIVFRNENGDNVNTIYDKSAGSSFVTNMGTQYRLKDESVGSIYSAYNAASNTNLYGIIFDKAGSNSFTKGIVFDQSYEVGINLANAANKKAIHIEGNGTGDSGVHIDGVPTGIIGNGYNQGIALTNDASATGVIVNGNGTGDYGLLTDGVATGIVINGNGTKDGILLNDTNIGINIDDGVVGIDINEPSQNAIKVSRGSGAAISGSYRGMVDVDTNQRQRAFTAYNYSIAGYSTDALADHTASNSMADFKIEHVYKTKHFEVVSPPTSEPSALDMVSAGGTIFIKNNGGTYQLLFWDGSAWNVVV